MATATFSIRMDTNLRKDFKKTCEEFGLTVTSAINVFASAVVNQKRIPFDIATKDAIINTGYKSFYDLKNDFQKNKNGDRIDYCFQNMCAFKTKFGNNLDSDKNKFFKIKIAGKTFSHACFFKKKVYCA